MSMEDWRTASAAACFFALDHTHYARWISVHLCDMESLREHYPAIYAEFLKGNFAMKKSRRAFSAIAIDQAHEQNNASGKVMVGL